MFELLFDGGWMYYIAFGVIGTLFLMMMLFLIGVMKDATVVHGIAFLFIAGFLTLIISQWTNILMWILLGLTLSSWAGVVFLLGCITMVCGMVASYLKEGSLVS
jgi:hypothetical protein